MPLCALPHSNERDRLALRPRLQPAKADLHVARLRQEADGRDCQVAPVRRMSMAPVGDRSRAASGAGAPDVTGAPSRWLLDLGEGVLLLLEIVPEEFEPRCPCPWRGRG